MTAEELVAAGAGLPGVAPIPCSALYRALFSIIASIIGWIKSIISMRLVCVPFASLATSASGKLFCSFVMSCCRAGSPEVTPGLGDCSSGDGGSGGGSIWC